METLTPFEWISKHIQVVGWPVVVYVSVYVTYHFIRFLGAIQNRVAVFEKTFMKIAENDLPHIQQSVEELARHVHGVDDTLGALREDLQLYVYRTLPLHSSQR